MLSDEVTQYLVHINVVAKIKKVSIRYFIRLLFPTKTKKKWRQTVNVYRSERKTAIPSWTFTLVDGFLQRSLGNSMGGASQGRGWGAIKHPSPGGLKNRSSCAWLLVGKEKRKLQSGREQMRWRYPSYCIIENKCVISLFKYARATSTIKHMAKRNF